MKKYIALILALMMTFGLLACGQAQTPEEAAPADTKPIEYEQPAQKVIHVLLPAAAEGWEADVVTLAMEKVQMLQEEGAFQVQTAEYADAQQQVALLEKIAAESSGDGSQAVVTMPAADDMADVFAKLVEANVSYALAGNIPAEAEAASVANVYLDQKTIGAAIAAWLVENGLTQKNRVVILQGLSEEEALRTDGFKEYLQGKIAYNGAVIETPWTSTENLVYSDMEGETAQSAEVYFTTYMEDADHAATKYLAAWDDAYALGVLEALEGENISAKNKAKFLEGVPFLASCGGSREMLDVLGGTTQYTAVASLGGLQTVKYDAALLANAITQMADHLSGQIVEQDQPQSIVWLTAEPAEQAEQTEQAAQ